MNFFTTLSGTGIKDVVIQVKEDATGSLTVFVTPKTIAEDSALKGLKPLHLTGTPEELDAEFFGLVTTPLQKTQNIFNNVEAYEAQMREVSKATADKKAEKDAAAKAKKDATPTEGSAPVEKEVKVNNEKALKDFMTSIKGQNIILSREKIEELYANLSEAELDKPFNKKVRVDLDIAIRKEDAIKAAKAKLTGTTESTGAESKEIHIMDVSNMTVNNGKIEKVATAEETTTASTIDVVEEPSMTEPTSDIPEFQTPPIGITKEESEKMVSTLTGEPVATMEVVKESPNVDSVPGPVTEQPTPVAPSVPTPEPVVQYEEVEVFEMIDKEYTREEYHTVGWTDELLVQHGKAHYTKVQQEVAPVAQKLSYTFPKEFDAPDAE